MTTYLWLIQNTLRACQGDHRHFTYSDSGGQVENNSVCGRHARPDYSDIYNILLLCKSRLSKPFRFQSKQKYTNVFKAVQFIHYVSDRPSRVATFNPRWSYNVTTWQRRSSPLQSGTIWLFILEQINVSRQCRYYTNGLILLLNKIVFLEMITVQYFHVWDEQWMGNAADL